MSKLLLISDLHYANRVGFGKELLNPAFKGCNSRFHEIAKAFNTYIELAVTNDCQALVVLGDWWHERGILPVPALNAAYSLLIEADKKIPVYIITGNHDVVSSKALYSEEGLHSLYTYQNICNIIDKPQILHLDDFSLSFIPFNIDKIKTLEAAKKLLSQSDKNKISISFFHHSFEGAMTGATNWRMPSEIKASEVPDFDLVFSGHLHKHQRVGKVVYVGSLLQHDIGERDYVPGGIIVNSSGEWKHIENKDSPRFVVINASAKTDLKSLQEKDYKVIKWHGEEAEGIKLREDINNVVVEITSLKKKVKIRTDINTADSVQEIFKKYVKNKFGFFNKEIYEEGISLYSNHENNKLNGK